jgi:membrane-bound metal-dependent hydrolase YbcI (DUF457 family)
MKIPEHLALSFLLAQFGAQAEYGGAGTGLMLAAGMLPDLDGLAVLGGWQCQRTYHRVVAHGLPVTLAGPALLAWLGWGGLSLGHFWFLWTWLQVALLAHLATDCLFYRWPAQLLWPLSTRGLGLGLIGWNDLVPTLLLYAGAVAAVLRPGPAVAAACLVALALYLTWRALRPRRSSGWGGWLTGDWSTRAAPVWRWLTGDFLPRAPRGTTKVSLTGS